MRKYWQYLVLIIISLVVAWQTYSPGTWQSGWDVLHPEFEFSTAFSRQLSGVWREDQGLGTLAIHAHMADLPRTLLLYLGSFVVPRELLRYGVLWLSLILGPLGVAALVKYLSGDKRGGSLASLMAGLFYLFNLSTLQQIYVPFPMFTVQYALMGWLVYSIVRYLREGGKGLLGWYLAFMLLIAPAAYAPTLWYAMFGSVFLFLLGYGIVVRRSWKRVRRLLGTGLLVNMYWLLPSLYTLKSSVDVAGSKINLMFSREAWLANAAYGKIGEIAQLKGFLLNWLRWDFESQTFQLLMVSWAEYLTQWWVGWMLIIMFVSGVVGLLQSIRSKDIQSRGVNVGMLLVGIVSVLGLLRTGLWGEIVEWVIRVAPIAKEVLRTPYTKFSIVLQLVISVGIGMLVVKTWEWKKWIGSVFTMALLFGVGVVGYPMIRGELLSVAVKSEIPDEYFQMFEYMKEQSDGRVVVMPAVSMFGWEYYEWGYQGAGFLQFGIPQPILVRDYDRWSLHNESFYNEFSTAMYGGYFLDVDRVLAKYDVAYVLLDESVIAPGQEESILRISETKKMAEQLGWKEKFQEGDLTVWETSYGQDDQFVSAPEKYTLVEGDMVKGRRDVIYEEVGDYVSGLGGVEYPFANLMREEIEIEYSDQGVMLSVETELGELIMPGYSTGERVEMEYVLKLNKGELRVEWQPEYMVNEQDGPKLSDQVIRLDDERYLWVQIGEGEAIFVEEGKPVISNARLIVGEPVEIVIYEGVVEDEQELELGDEQECGENGQYRCYATPLDESNRDSLVQTITYYEGEGSPEVCLDLDDELYQCVNESRVEEGAVVVTIPIKQGEVYWLDYVLRNEKTVLQNSVVRSFKLSEKFVVSSTQWEEIEKVQKYSLQDSTLKVEAGGEAKIYDYAKLGREEALNCDVLERGRVSKTGNRYEAGEYGANCDYLELSGLDTRLSYLMRMSGENLEGRSVKLFLHNTGSGRNDLEYLLDEGKFDQTFSILNWEFPGSYSLNIETRSFGQNSENKVSPVELRYFPLEQISKAKITTDHGQQVVNNLEIVNVQKTGTWLYRVQIEGVGLLSLSQGYDDGWVAWSGGLREHVIINGWKNGWLVEGDEQITIFYWPQLLEYLGFVMLGATVWWLVKMKDE